ncbi:MAG: DUF108 domain-containing protein [Candidatus Omnitrophica bacterium]|nr:DUF108 domain-containing protein [Candidatus Omnitrophota bacterium]
MNKKLKIGIVGCGAIGQRMSKMISKKLYNSCIISALYDINHDRALKLEKQIAGRSLVQGSVKNVIKKSDLIIEAVNAPDTAKIIELILTSKKSVLAMSVGKTLRKANQLFKLALKNNCFLLLPSGAIAGIDAIKAAGLSTIDKITLTTRKPVKGLPQNKYLTSRNIDLKKIKKETTVFQGSVFDAVKHFPQNINVAATLALASKKARLLVVNIVTSPHFTSNSHEICVEGSFGKILTRTENVPCPDNPKTSYLAVLSGMQTLKQFCEKIFIGT